MSIKKLIGETTDFGNVRAIAQRWKKSEVDHQSIEIDISQNHPKTHHGPNESFDISEHGSETKENYKNSVNVPASVNISLTSNGQTQLSRNPIPQILDEDTEHFRNRLESLLNSFKTDAVCEFMGMKRSLLAHQNETIKNDTQKYLSLCEAKHQELLSVKEQLINVTAEAEKKTAQCDRLVAFVVELKKRNNTLKHLVRPFDAFKQNRNNAIMLKQRLSQAQLHRSLHMKQRCLWAWRKDTDNLKMERREQELENKVETEIKDYSIKFQKETDLLKTQLDQALKKIQEHEMGKHMLQQDLKKAFLRGFSAMNLEALTFDPSKIDSKSNFTTSQMREEDSNRSLANHSQNFPFTQACLMGQSQPALTSQLPSQTHMTIHHQSTPSHNSPSLLLPAPRLQSKDHRWRQAPILGLEQAPQYEEPRQGYNVAPKIPYSAASVPTGLTGVNISMVAGTTGSGISHSGAMHEDIKPQIVRAGGEGKVIRVVEGRSVGDNKKGPNQSQTKVGSAKRL